MDDRVDGGVLGTSLQCRSPAWVTADLISRVTEVEVAAIDLRVIETERETLYQEMTIMESGSARCGNCHIR